MDTQSNQLRVEFTKADLRRLIVPLVIEQLLSITVGLSDSLMVSQVGEAAISAVSLVDTVNVLLVNAFASLATGGAVITGQYLGRREIGKAGHSAQQLLLFMGEVSLVVMVLFYLGKGFVLNVVFGQVEPDVAAYANTYYVIVEASIPFLALYSAGAALFRVMGNSGTSMWVSTAMNAINVVGNGLLIFVFHRGVEGVAIPTLVSRIFAAGAMLVLLRRPDLPMQVERFTFRHDRFVVKNILHFGVPNGIEGSMFQLGKILLLSTVSVLGTASVAANAIGNTLASFQVVPGTALGLAIVTVVSRCVGASEYDRARYYTKKMMRTAYLYTVLVIALILACLPLILKLYNVSDQAREWATQILWMHGICGILIWPLAFTLPQALRAAGDTRFTMVASTVSMWTLRVGLGILLGRYWGFGVVGIWIAMFADWVLRAALFVPRFHGHKWETMGLKN
ncbi:MULTISPECIES: MATE family efflux transporter [environmental samples]|uniref:MATE family efflux transporter n=1 Tax=environmental samples TaxID=876090 RepID=UPI0003351321|nr:MULTISPECIES: MATE family efflux transporter [environmental samples]CDC69233.1 matE efflux family protein [Oscillibacter sp. CAG:155]